jgi:hypothetical protein
MSLMLRLNYERRSLDQGILVSGTRLGPLTRFLVYYVLLFNSCEFLNVGPTSWGEDSSVNYTHNSQSVSGVIPSELVAETYALISVPITRGPGPRIYIHQRQIGPVVPPSTGFPFCSLLWLARSRLKYPNNPPRIHINTWHQALSKGDNMKIWYINYGKAGQSWN